MNPVQFKHTLVTIYCNPKGKLSFLLLFLLFGSAKVDNGMLEPGTYQKASLQSVATTPVAQWMEWHLIRPHDFVDLSRLRFLTYSL